jgi:hypothetical protein
LNLSSQIIYLRILFAVVFTQFSVKDGDSPAIFDLLIVRFNRQAEPRLDFNFISGIFLDPDRFHLSFLCHLLEVLAECSEFRNLIKGMKMRMSGKLMKSVGLAIPLLVMAACASVQPTDTQAPPPPQNLLGSTDELQLVVELSLEQALRYGAGQVLVVLNLENVLLTNNPAQPGEAQPIEAGAAEQVRRLQDQGLKVIVISAQSPESQEQVTENLHRTGFDFQVSAWPPKDGYPQPFIPKSGLRPVLYQNGVFFVDDQDRGVMLQSLLEKAGVPNPTLMILADSEQKNLNAVMKSFSWTATKVHAWRYTRER